MSPKIILVTGANRGIGFGIVQALAEKSSENTLIVASRKRSDAKQAIVEAKNMGLENPFYPFGLDVTSDESINSAVKEVEGHFGRLDGKLQHNTEHSLRVLLC